jgi:hypothetical protein
MLTQKRLKLSSIFSPPTLIAIAIIALEIAILNDKGPSGLKILAALNIFFVLAMMVNYSRHLKLVLVLIAALLPSAYPLQNFDVPGPIKYYSQILILLALCFLPTKAVSDNHRNQNLGVPPIFYLTSITWFVLLILALIPKFPSSAGTFLQIAAVLVTIGFLKRFSFKEIDRALVTAITVLTFGTTLSLMISGRLMEFFDGNFTSGIKNLNTIRFGSELQDYEMTSQLFTCFFILQLMFLLDDSSKGSRLRRLVLWNIPQLALIIVLSGTRSGLYVILLSTFVFAFMKRNASEGLLLPISFIVLISILVIRGPFASILLNLNTTGGFSKLVNRDTTWEYFLNRSDWPGLSLLGTGLPLSLSPGESLPHSAYLFVWYVSGFLGFVIFLFLTVSWMIFCLKSLFKYDAPVVKYLVTLLALFMDGVKVEYFRTFTNTFLFFFLFFALRSASRENIRK